MESNIFSAHYPATFTINHLRYRSIEQYYLAQKAGPDAELFEEILLAKPEQLSELWAREIKNFSQELWDEEKREILKAGNLAKFAQNKEIGKLLGAAESFNSGWEMLDKVLSEVKEILKENYEKSS